MVWSMFFVFLSRLSWISFRTLLRIFLSLESEVSAVGVGDWVVCVVWAWVIFKYKMPDRIKRIFFT